MSIRHANVTTFIVVVALFLSTGVFGSPSLKIVSPADDSVFTTNSVNVTGTANGSDAQWVQTEKADFDAGTLDNASSNAGGNVSLNASIYDDFNDNSFDNGRWTMSSVNGVGVTVGAGSVWMRLIWSAKRLMVHNLSP